MPALLGRTAGLEALIAADITVMPFRDATFDAIVDKGTLDWFVLSLLVASDRDYRLAHLRAEMLRLLRPGGCLIVITGLGGTDEDPAGFLGAADGLEQLHAGWEVVERWNQTDTSMQIVCCQQQG